MYLSVNEKDQAVLYYLSVYYYKLSMQHKTFVSVNIPRQIHTRIGTIGMRLNILRQACNIYNISIKKIKKQMQRIQFQAIKCSWFNLSHLYTV